MRWICLPKLRSPGSLGRSLSQLLHCTESRANGWTHSGWIIILYSGKMRTSGDADTVNVPPLIWKYENNYWVVRSEEWKFKKLCRPTVAKHNVKSSRYRNRAHTVHTKQVNPVLQQMNPNPYESLLQHWFGSLMRWYLVCNHQRPPWERLRSTKDGSNHHRGHISEANAHL